MLIKSVALKSLLIVILLCSVKCIDKSVYDVSKNVYFIPSYSLPIGPAQVVAKNIINSTNFQTIDTATARDTTGYFWYDSVFYDAKPGYIDTIIDEKFDFSTLSDKLNLTKSLMIRLNVSNGFPADIFVQLYFNNESNQVVDSLFNSGYLKIVSASVNTQGNVTNPSILNNYDTYLDRSEIDRLILARDLRLFIRVETKHSGTPYIKLYPEYRIDLDLAFRIELDMNLGDF